MSIADSLDADREAVSAIAEHATERYPDEPFRQKVSLVRERLTRIEDARPGGYDDADDFLTDLEDIAAGLCENGLKRLAESTSTPCADRSRPSVSTSPI